MKFSPILCKTLSWTKLSVLFILLISCTFNRTENQQIQATGNTISERFLPPVGYERKPIEGNSFGIFLRNFALKKADEKVYLFDGTEKPRSFHAAVLDIDRGKQDLQQCADAVMRLRAEFLFSEKKYDQISFKNFAGTAMTYTKYRQGYRMKASGYQKVSSENTSREGFRKYLDMIFSYANTFTLEREMKAVLKLQEMQVGDVFIVSNPRAYGHAMLIVDIAENPKTKQKAFLLAQSYMPAQDIHIVKNPKGGTWFLTEDLTTELLTYEWTFPVGALRRF
jgi:Domain of unknown function (4846)